MFKNTDRLAYYLMILPGLVFLFAFTFVPLFYSVIAFQRFNPALGITGSPWVGLDNILFMFTLRDARQVFFNTVFIASMKIVFMLLTAVLFALLLNEVRVLTIRRSIQTMVYLPHFLSWVILAGILRTILARDGMVSNLLGFFGIGPIYFLGQPNLFPWVIIFSDVWKEFGFEAIVFLAALTAIDPTLYEVAELDGANRFQKMWYISLPGIAPVIVLVGSLSIGNILNAGFDQIFNLYSPIVYSTGDIIDTYVYRIGLIQGQYSLGTAVGLFKTVVALILIGISYWIAGRYANYRIF
ncbi:MULTISPECIES: ABC transporter permease [Caldilinea]|jgi:putative aldouronate transport system permease protein|uniref:Putative ABC transporter permease protein n=1 Tax=Caldilinea aerophila (strain DSM 14535 / JCM 11387 / NBRC 104270 / STL-6-O1) TaxID=926550 RepID=I0HYP6_CALAS|nr:MULTISPECIES: ABC transporter permease subunit [Caldilinea]BAL98133.1 putative ABC transporter permease protein [Caldilinea aerophila DSM 14535 = NBRC 104270]GIV75450.1 MAG: sugar ABC transporter permease [Caldilinea sp.]